MALDPNNQPIWLRKLHVTAAQVSPSDYPPTPEEGLLLVCRLSDAQRAWVRALSTAGDDSVHHESASGSSG